MISSNFSFPFGRFRKPSTIFKFHELSQTFSDFLSIFHYFSWFRTFAAWSEGPFSQVFHNESSHDRQGRSLNVFLSSSTLYILHRRCCEFYEWFTGRGFVLQSYF